MLFFKKKKPNGGQGSHFVACFPEPGLMEKIVMHSLNSPDKSKTLSVNLLDMKNAKLVAISKIIDKSLSVTTLVVNGTIYTAYPINRNFTLLEGCKNPKVEEWANELEGWVSINAGPAILTFFPIDYYENKEKYHNSINLNIGFSGIAYDLYKAENEKIESKYGTLKTDKMCSLIPNNFSRKGFFPDDYFFRGEVLDIQSDKVDGKSFFVKVINDSKHLLFSMWIRCASKNIKDKIKKGDYVSGNLWLQGTLLLSFLKLFYMYSGV